MSNPTNSRPEQRKVHLDRSYVQLASYATASSIAATSIATTTTTHRRLFVAQILLELPYRDPNDHSLGPTLLLQLPHFYAAAAAAAAEETRLYEHSFQLHVVSHESPDSASTSTFVVFPSLHSQRPHQLGDGDHQCLRPFPVYRIPAFDFPSLSSSHSSSPAAAQVHSSHARHAF